MQRTAYFVRQPRRIKDLFPLHAVDRERTYEIAKAITLPRFDYENFISDLTVDREFLGNNASLCSMDNIWKCLLIKREIIMTAFLSSQWTANGLAGLRIIGGIRNNAVAFVPNLLG